MKVGQIMCQEEINNSFWEIVIPVTILDIKKWDVKRTKNTINNISTRMEIIVFFKEEIRILLHPY